MNKNFKESGHPLGSATDVRGWAKSPEIRRFKAFWSSWTAESSSSLTGVNSVPIFSLIASPYIQNKNIVDLSTPIKSGATQFTEPPSQNHAYYGACLSNQVHHSCLGTSCPSLQYAPDPNDHLAVIINRRFVCAARRLSIWLASICQYQRNLNVLVKRKDAVMAFMLSQIRTLERVCTRCQSVAASDLIGFN